MGFGREICGNLAIAETREWLVTNGIGGYASGTVSGILTRRYHGLLVAALEPPLGRTVLVSQLDETARYGDRRYSLYTNRWSGDTIDPHGYRHIESFDLEGTVPVWRFALGDAIIEKRIWMAQGSNTTYIRYSFQRGSRQLRLIMKGFVNYRDYHGDTSGGYWKMQVKEIDGGILVKAFNGATPFYLLADRGKVLTAHQWYFNFDMAAERYRGLRDREDRLHAATFDVTLQPGESFTVVATTQLDTDRDGKIALENRYNYDRSLCDRAFSSYPQIADSPDKENIAQLILAADQFVVDRPFVDRPRGKTVIAGYHWFGDWGRDTTIALPGLTIFTGRPEIARSILDTFSQYLDKGMLPNLFPDGGADPEYNTVDAILWFFEAIRLYYEATNDRDFIDELFPKLAEVIDWHRRGTRYNIHLDSDGLIYAGQPGTQLTWMDAKVDDWVVTPRQGKPIEVSALWYNALKIMVTFADRLGKSASEYEELARQTAAGFDRFWNAELGYCYDVLDTPNGNDASLRPNQIFAVSLPDIPLKRDRQKQVVDVVARSLLTSYGLRSLTPEHPDYQGIYEGDRRSRDGAYHQGTVWGWLLGPFARAYAKVYRDRATAKQFLEPMFAHLNSGAIGSLNEIFDGDPPHTPRGCIAQAWTVAEVLRSYISLS